MRVGADCCKHSRNPWMAPGEFMNVLSFMKKKKYIFAEMTFTKFKEPKKISSYLEITSLLAFSTSTMMHLHWSHLSNFLLNHRGWALSPS